MTKQLRVVLVDDHEVVRLGLISLLEDLDWIEIVAEAGTADAAIAAAREQQPDVVIMDVRMPGESGIEACRVIRQETPETQVLMLTSYADDALVREALAAGACSYVLKQVGNYSLVNALETLRRGDIPETMPGQTSPRSAQPAEPPPGFERLTHRELEILRELALGKSNQEIADTLSLAEKTVRNYVSAVLTKLNCSNRIEAITYALRHGLDQYLDGV
ncbi:MAG: response regulator transcription factor [Anaerolineae bacterium]|nr:response regulator transcription factor [Anaerolineae bacterium]